MDLHCLRHGLTCESVKGVYHGASGGTLTGEQRAALSALRFDTTAYDAIYCSPLARCVETASALRIPAWLADERLVERHFGIFGDLSPNECVTRYPVEFGRFREFDEWYQIPEGESRAQHLARTVGWLQDIAHHRRVLAITHGGTVDFLYRMARGLPLHDGTEAIKVSNASLSTFRIDWPVVELLSFDAVLGPV
jgi:broad specificity phosphatase PhoE